MTKSIGDRIRELRESRNWTQDDLAEKAGLNRVTIAKYETEKVEPKSKTLSKLADVLEVTPDYLLNGNMEMSDDEKEVWELREQVRRDPERHYLFSVARDADIEEVRQAVAIIDALKQTRR